MSEVEEDYSDYIKHMSNISSLGTVLAGFTLKTLTLLITLLPDPSQITVQVTLFFLAFLFDTFMFLTGWTNVFILYFCRRVPRSTRQMNILNRISSACFNMVGVAIAMIFFLSNLNYLALASALTWTLFIIVNYTLIWKPFSKFHETRARLLGKAKNKETDKD